MRQVVIGLPFLKHWHVTVRKQTSVLLLEENEDIYLRMVFVYKFDARS